MVVRVSFGGAVPFGLHLQNDVDYDAIDAVNQSSLKPLLQRSPKHYLHRLDHPSTSTRSQFRGTAAHTALLEPARFADEYTVFDGRRGTKAWDAFEAANVGKTILSQKDYDEAERMARAVRSDPAARRYVAEGGHNECVLYWRDPHSGLACKGRTDRITEVDGGAVIVDLKGTKDATPKWFGRDAATFLYHMQAAFYADGYEVITMRPARYVVVAVEFAEPHDVVVYTLDEETLALGRDEYRAAIAKLIECRANKHFPGIANELEMPLVLPPWTRPNEDDLADLDLEV